MLTRRGWTTAGDVRVGDELVGSDGKFTRVSGRTEWQSVALYRVEFSDGASLVTCGAHRWSVRQRYGGPWRVRNTAELSSDLSESDGRCKWRIPVVAPVVGTASKLPIDPYILGAWLGDGSSYKAEITSADPYVVRAFRHAGYRETYRYQRGAASTYGFTGGLYVALKALGLIGNKEIPECYLSANLPSRIALLQGLADTDGTVAPNGSQQSISTTSEKLAVGIRRLVASLGGVVREFIRPKAEKTEHIISFRLPQGIDGFRLQRKLSRLAKPTARNKPRRFVSGIFPVVKGDATCFEVEASDHLFCAGSDLVVTHNSETIKHGIVKHLLRFRDDGVAYCTHTQSFASAQSRSIRKIATAAGLKFSQDSNRQDEWELAGCSGGLVARGVGGELTGRGFRLIVVDDPIKSREDAESVTIRDKTWEWIQDDVVTRLTPDGTLLLVHTRWHPDDPIGRAKTHSDWQGRNIPALSGQNDDVALLPHVWSVEQLQKIRDASPYRFASLYQGEPRPRGGKLFGEPSWYQPGSLPTVGYTQAHGIDLAYSANNWADRSVILSGVKDRRGNIYLTHGQIERIAAPEFAEIVKRRLEALPGAVRWYHGAGGEKGIASFYAALGCPIDALPATTDKFVRAQPAAAAWNSGRVLLPSTGNGHQHEWVTELIGEVTAFTGVKDAHDDIVDALAALVDELGFDVDLHDEGDLNSSQYAEESRWAGMQGMGY